jgi:hypothetical protein
VISTVLSSHPWLTTVGLVVLVLVGTPLAVWLATRPRTAYVLAGVATLPVAVLTLWPTDRDLPVGCAQEWSVPTLGRVELVANIVLFVAPVLLLAVASRRPVLAVLAGTATSFGIEAVQSVATVLGRSCSTNDWMSNTLGAVLGGVLAALALAVSRRASTPQPQPEIPVGSSR